MAKGKDFYGSEISTVIEQACKALGTSREDLDIEVLETGSAGIFGLCKKKAHIRVQRKTDGTLQEVAVEPKTPARQPVEAAVEPAANGATFKPVLDSKVPEEVNGNQAVVQLSDSRSPRGKRPEKSVEPVVEEQEVELEDLEEVLSEPPSDENLTLIQEDLHRLLSLMGLPSEVQVVFEQNTVLCSISGPHEAHVVGPEGRTLDSLQYLLRKMVSRLLPDKIMLALNAGDFRERRAEELKIRAVELAAQVKEDGKTQAIAALNPSERRVVHMALQDDKGIRSRSVGEGLFKKVLIYKPGKGRRPVSKKRRGGSGGRPSGD